MAQDYKRISDGPDTVVFKENGGTGCLSFIFGLVGLPMLLAGIYFSHSAYIEGGNMGIPVILTGAGLAFFSVFFIILVTRSDTPHQIIFDNANGCVRLKQKKQDKGISEAIIPYEDIDGFGIRTRSTSSSSSSGKTSYYYQVYFQKTDGGRWDLLYHSNPKKSEKQLQWLEEHIKLSNSCKQPMKPVLPERVTRGTVRGYDWLQWKNPIDSTYGFFGAILTGFIIVGVGIILKFNEKGGEGNDDFVGWAFLGFCGFVALAVLYNIYKEIVTTYGLLFTHQDLQFIEIVNGEEKVTRVIPLEELGSVAFDFDENEGGGMMSVFTKEQLHKIHDRDQGQMDWKTAWNSIRALMYVPQVKMKIPVVERVHMEKYIQDLLSKNGGGHVL